MGRNIFPCDLDFSFRFDGDPQSSSSSAFAGMGERVVTVARRCRRGVSMIALSTSGAADKDTLVDTRENGSVVSACETLSLFAVTYADVDCSCKPASRENISLAASIRRGRRERFADVFVLFVLERLRPAAAVRDTGAIGKGGRGESTWVPVLANVWRASSTTPVVDC